MRMEGPRRTKLVYKRQVLLLLLVILLAVAPVAARAGIFDDGNDRKLIKELRAKNPATLNEEEKAILAAANKVGNIGLCKGKVGGNAFLIRFRNRDAVVTSAHMVLEVDRDRRAQPTCDHSEMAPSYMPNTAYYDMQAPDRGREFIMRRVDLLAPPVNLADIENGFRFEGDFAVFYLTEQVSDDRMPDGTIRGALEFSTLPIDGDNLFMLGIATDISSGMELVYQKDCITEIRVGRFYHGCDTLKGSSGSLLAKIERGSLTFRGLHTSGTQDVEPAENIKIIPNVGTSSEHIQRLMEEQTLNPNPIFLAYDIQWALHRTGCYSGKLDNKWGPGSRKALAAFATATGVTLPGAEPSAELLAAVEKVTAEGAGRCPQ